MLDTIADDCLVTRPDGASSAYGTVIRRTESSREIEYRVFEQVTTALQEAATPEAHFADRIVAVHHNRELWQTLAFDLASPDNALPAALRAQMISLAIWVTRETDRVTRLGAPLESLITVNRSVMQGLRPLRQKAD